MSGGVGLFLLLPSFLAIISEVVEYYSDGLHI